MRVFHARCAFFLLLINFVIYHTHRLPSLPWARANKNWSPPSHWQLNAHPLVLRTQALVSLLIQLPMETGLESSSIWPGSQACFRITKRSQNGRDFFQYHEHISEMTLLNLVVPPRWERLFQIFILNWKYGRWAQDLQHLPLIVREVSMSLE